MGKFTDEEVEHDVSNDDIEGAKIDESLCEMATISLPIIGTPDAKRGSHHAVVHDLIPILPGHNAKQHRDGVPCRLEVG